MSATLDRRIHDIFDAERYQLLDDLAAAEDRLEAKESEKYRVERKLVAANSRLKVELQSIQKEFEQYREANCKAVVGMSRFREKSDAAEEEVVHLRARLEDSEGRYRNERRLRAAAEKSWSEKYTQLEAETLRVRRLADERLGLIDVKYREWSQERSKLQAQLDALRLEIGREAGLLARDPSRRHRGGAYNRQTRKQAGGASKAAASGGEQPEEHDSEQLPGEGGVESEDDELVADAALTRAEEEGLHSGRESAPGSVGRWEVRGGEGSRAGDESVGTMGGAGTHRDGAYSAGHGGGFTQAAVRRRQGRLIRELRQRCRQLRAEMHRAQMEGEQAAEDARKEHQRALDAIKNDQAAQLLAHQGVLYQLNKRLKQTAAQARHLSSSLKTAERERAALGEQLGKSRAECAAVQQTAHELRRELERLVHAGASEIYQRVDAASQSAARVVYQHYTDLRDCRSELASARSRGATLETELDEARGAIAGLRARLEAARGDAASARAEAAEARTRLEMLESRRGDGFEVARNAADGGKEGHRRDHSESMSRGIIGRLHADNARLLQREADLVERCRALEAQHEAGEVQCDRLRGEIQRMAQAVEDGREQQGGLKGLIRDLQQDRLRLRAQMKRMQGMAVGKDGHAGMVSSRPDVALLGPSTGTAEDSKGASGVGFAFGGYPPVGHSVAAQAVRGLVAPASSLQSTPDGGRMGKGKDAGRGTSARAIAGAGAGLERGYMHGGRDGDGDGDETQDPADPRTLQHVGVSGLGGRGGSMMDPGAGSGGEWAGRQEEVRESVGGGGKAPEMWSGLSTAEFRQDVLVSRQYSPGGGRAAHRRT